MSQENQSRADKNISLSVAELWAKPAHWVIVAPKSIVTDQRQWLEAGFLSPDEQVRHQRFRRQQDRDRYLLAHSLKRLCMGALLDLPVMECCFSANDKGKPYCENPGAPEFNLSHSGDWVALAVSASGLVGVDIEAADREIGDGVAGYALNPVQLAQAQSDAERLLFWTQKEAISKALGKGLSIDFQTLECSGCLGVSEAVHSGQSLRVESQYVGRGLAEGLANDLTEAKPCLLSVASTAVEKPLYCLLDHWQGDELGFFVIEQ